MSFLRQILQDPFGPYPEDFISLEWKEIVSLHSLHMECGAFPIGFDETEFVTNAPETSRIAQSVTKFYGLLKLDRLDRLSQRGRKYLQRELERRYAELSDRKPSDLQLKKVLHGSPLNIWIQCIKTTNALFLTANGHETSLLLTSKTRTYNIVSLSASLFDSSRNFLLRYRLWALIENLVQDSHVTSLENRTIDWLIKQYKSRLQRYSFAHRHVSRAEITGIFAAHADWVLAQHLATTSTRVKKLNVQQWISFCTQVKAARVQAHRSHLPACFGWGLPNNGMITDDILDLSHFGVLRGGWAKKIQNVKKKKALSETQIKVCTF
ncbi:hypothetical protein H0H92_007209 [Tricholoma furcatifolium]|nr:hypothetical protein H0H92_007209 [Tricholoma furcatifolium]